LEAVIAHHQNMIEEYEKEIKAIEGQLNLQETGPGYRVCLLCVKGATICFVVALFLLMGKITFFYPQLN
jgi:hypothetical protein